MTLLHLRGNALGLAIIVITGAIAGIGSLVFQLADALVMMSVSGALIVMDVLIRLRFRPAMGWLTQSQFGGFLFFVPVWGVGVLIIVINLVNTFFN